MNVHELIINNQPVKLEEYLYNGGRCETHDREGRGCVSSAVHNHRLECFRVLIKYGADLNQLNNDIEGKGVTPLISAVECGEKKMLMELIQAGADVNLNSKEGKSAMIAAVEKQDVEQINVLFQAGADINTQFWPLTICPEYVNRCNVPGLTAIGIACLLDNMETINTLISLNVNLNVKLGHETTLLMCATYARNWKGLRTLCQHGCNTNEMDRNGITALMLSVNKNLNSVLQFWDMEYVHVHKEIPYCTEEDFKSIKILLKFGAYVNQRSTWGLNALESHQCLVQENDISWQKKNNIWGQKCSLLLQAAGEVIQIENEFDIPGPVMRSNASVIKTLKSLSRKEIRRNLGFGERGKNLFIKCQELFLPLKLQEYLVYNHCLEIQ